MRILYSHYLTDPNHPAVVMVEQISRELRKLGHEVKVYASNGLNSPVGDTSSSKIREFSTPIKTMKRALWFAKTMNMNRSRLIRDRQAIADFQPDIVLARQDAYCWSVAKAAAQSEIPVVTYADAPVAYECRTFNLASRWHPPGIVEWVEKRGLHASRAVISVSNPGANRLRRYNLTVPIHVVSNGFDASCFPESSQSDREKLRSELGVKSPLVIGFQGSFKAFHGLDRLGGLIRSTKDVDVTWLLIGDGPEHQAFKKSVSSAGNTVFLGRRPASEMPQLLSVIDIAVAPHTQLKGDFYFCPLKIIEYAAAGCATIASDQGDIPLLLADGKGGCIVKDDSLESWKSMLDRLIHDEEYRTTVAKIGREYVFQNLTWKHTAENVSRVLEDSGRSFRRS